MTALLTAAPAKKDKDLHWCKSCRMAVRATVVEVYPTYVDLKCVQCGQVGASAKAVVVK